jgi:hypothetical protein
VANMYFFGWLIKNSSTMGMLAANVTQPDRIFPSFLRGNARFT